MAVKKGSEVRVYVGAYDLSLMATTAGIGMEAPALDKTVFVDSAESATADIRRDTFSVAGFFDDQAQGVDALIGTLIGTRGDVVSFLVGTATGNRAYVGTVLVASAKVAGRMGELARVEVDVKLDGSLLAMKHFGPKIAGTNNQAFGSVDDTTGTSGTGYFITHMLQYGATGATINVLLYHGTDGTTFASKTQTNFTGIGSTLLTFTGSLDRYVRLEHQYSGSIVGTNIFVGAYRRP